MNGWDEKSRGPFTVTSLDHDGSLHHHTKQKQADLIRTVGSTHRNRLDDINNNCSKYFRMHWKCLDNNNQQLWHCRRFEQALNACVFDKLVRKHTPPFSVSLSPSPSPSSSRPRIPHANQRILLFAPGTREDDPRRAGKRDPRPPAGPANLFAKHLELSRAGPPAKGRKGPPGRTGSRSGRRGERSKVEVIIIDGLIHACTYRCFWSVD